LVPLSEKNVVIDETYPSRQLLDLIGDKWTPLVLYVLGYGTQRYSTLQRQIPGVSKKMLTQTLRHLEQSGLLKRKVYPVVPPRVEYVLTPLGQKFVEPVAALCQWAQEHQGELTAVRKHQQKRRPPR